MASTPDEQALQAYPILKYFTYDHLPPHLQTVSRPFAALAFDMAIHCPRCAETSAGLRKLLEAKDCLVRAALESWEVGKDGAE